MFSGIIEDIGQVKYISEDREVIAIETSFTDIKMGESISCSGVCLTVSNIQKSVFFSDLSPETLKKTTLSKLKVGDYINLEKSLKMGQEISGHMVFGHVDGFSKINSIKKLNMEIMRMQKLLDIYTGNSNNFQRKSLLGLSHLSNPHPMKMVKK